MKKNTCLFAIALLLASCSGQNNSSEADTRVSSEADTRASSEADTSISNESVSSKELLKFSDARFDSFSVSYDGNEHILTEVSGIPEGTKVTYSNRKNYIDVGSYACEAVLNKDGYEEKSLSATLTILPIDFSGISFESKTITYDGNDHFEDVQVVGFLPEGSVVSQKVYDANQIEVNEAIEVGTYYYTAKISNKNYNELTLSATLTIKANRMDMPVFVSEDGTIYFSNGLDENALYAFKDSTFKKIDNTTVKEFNKYSSSEAIYIGSSLFQSAAKAISNTGTSVLYTEYGMNDFVKKDENTYYYSKNNLFGDDSGIYKVTLKSEEEPVVEKMFSGKTDNLSIYGNYLYFENNSNSGYLYRMDLSSKASTCILENKIHDYVINNNKLYCVLNNKINDFIGYIELSSANPSVNKITNSAGEFLAIKNNYLYYNYTDLFGLIDETKKGIYRINLQTRKEEQILQIDGINGMDIENDNSLVYVEEENARLYRYNLTNKTKTDLLNGFVPPETTPLNTGGKTIKYGNDIYFLNMYDGKCLYKYNELSGKTTKASENKVADFFIYNDYLYFNSVTLLVNNDIYLVDLKKGNESKKINTNDIRNLVSDGNYIYGTHYNFAGAAGGIARMELNGENYTKFSEVNGAKNFTIKDEKLYFINCTTGQDNGDIQYYNLSDITNTSSDLKPNDLPAKNKIKNVRQFIIEEDTIYYIYQGTIYNFIARSSLSTLEEGTKLVNERCAPKEMIMVDDEIYYYSYPQTSSANAGLFKVNKNTKKTDTEYEKILACEGKYYCSSICYSSNSIYFLNYTFLLKLPYGDAHFYKIDLTSKNVTKIK